MKKNINSQKELITIFNNALAKNGANSPEAVCWGTRATQYYRFKILCDASDFFGDKDCAVLDWGCGLGDLYDYMHFQGFRGPYVGVDINENLIAEAKKKYMKYPKASFMTIMSSKDVARFSYDYCLLSGVFNIAVTNNEEELKKTVYEAFTHARRGVAFNALSTYAKEKNRSLAYLNPFALGEWCTREITQYVTVRHDYRGGNFTIYLYKDRGVDF